MRLPWNRKYMEISFHVVITVLILTVAAGILFRLPDAKNVISETARDFLAVFSPVFWAFFFSLLLEPLVSFWQRVYEKQTAGASVNARKMGTAFAYISAVLFLCLLGGFLARRIGNTDIQEIVAQISAYIRRTGDILVLLNLKLAEMGLLSNVEGFLSLWTEQATAWAEMKLMQFANSLPHIGGNLLDIIIGLAAAFYLLMEKDACLSVCRSFSSVFFGKRVTITAGRCLREIYTVFSEYLSGQILDACIMAILFSGAFLLVGLPHGVFLGIVSGFSNLIPYFGAVVAIILAVVSGLLSGMPVKALYGAGMILLLQQADSLFIVPHTVGKKVELHPALVILSLAVFGRAFGFWGLLLAVPLGALCKKFLFWLYERKKSDFRQ